MKVLTNIMQKFNQVMQTHRN